MTQPYILLSPSETFRLGVGRGVLFHLAQCPATQYSLSIFEGLCAGFTFKARRRWALL